MEFNKVIHQKTLIEIRRGMLELLYEAKEGHLPSSYSVLELIYALYLSRSLCKEKDKEPHFILSKGHAALALYAVLRHFQVISEAEYRSYCKSGSLLAGHPSHKISGVLFSTGSLGHGIIYAVGMCIGLKIRNDKREVYALIGDGELNEGSVWESLLLVQSRKLNNFKIIIDKNESTTRCLTVEDMEEKFRSFGFTVFSCDGNDLQEVQEVLGRLRNDRPCCVIAHTIKGFGIKSMESSFEWHHKTPDERQYKEFLKELET